VDRTDRIVPQLLELAAVERSEEDSEQTVLTRLMHETVADLRVLAKGREVKLETAAPDRAVWMRTSPFLLQAAWRNVIENAIHASPRRARGTVTLDSTTFVIRDEGGGIPPELLDRVRTRFTRGLDSGTNGSGLGLSIVASAMQPLNGEVKFGQGRNGEGGRRWN